MILADGGEGFDEFDNPDDDELGDDDDLPELEKPTRELHLDAEGKLRDQDGNEVDEPFGEDDLDGEAIERIERPVRAAVRVNVPLVCFHAGVVAGGQVSVRWWFLSV